MKSILKILSILSLIIALIYATTTKEGTEMIEYSFIIDEPMKGETEIITDTIKPDLFNTIFRPFETNNELRHDKEVDEIRLKMYDHTLQNIRTIWINGESREHRLTTIFLMIVMGITLFIIRSILDNDEK